MEYPLQKGGNILNETIIPKIISMSGFQLPPFNGLILQNIQSKIQIKLTEGVSKVG